MTENNNETFNQPPAYLRQQVHNFLSLTAIEALITSGVLDGNALISQLDERARVVAEQTGDAQSSSLDADITADEFLNLRQVIQTAMANKNS
jgi:hypothetical protein